ncbi:MAG TPA: Fe-S cluster assembly protein SufD [Verrucomicrobiae bacterium]|nr:Fe-S cluster assembly protein SufD [Verrucomicrobiae bacterium]
MPSNASTGIDFIGRFAGRLHRRGHFLGLREIRLHGNISVRQEVEIMTKNHSSKAVEPIVKQFAAVEASAQPKWLLPLRKNGIHQFSELGFPTLHDEDWRFTNVSPVEKLPFTPATEIAVNGAESNILSDAIFPQISGNVLVFVNGFFSAKLSAIKPAAKGARIENLSAAMAKDSAFIEKHFGKYAHTANDSFAALNQAFFSDGAFIYIPQGIEIEPVQLVYISSAKQNGETIQPRNLIIAEANSRLTIVETYLSASNSAYFTNAVTEIVAGENAFVEHIKIQDEATSAFHIATIAGEFGRASNVSVHSFALGAKLSRNNIRTKLAGEGLECVLNGLYLTRDEQLADHHMIVEHARPRCASHEYFNGILDDKSKGVFHGRIYVHPIAQKTDAKQTNKNLLLSDDASADTKPQLEIYADDVKCTHGATIGQLNEESIFYLRARGIPEKTARRMLIHAFAGEIVERVQCTAVREGLDKIVWNRLEANPHLLKS